MFFSEAEYPITIKAEQRAVAEIQFYGGFITIIMATPAVNSLFQGDWHGILFIIAPVCIFYTLHRLMQYMLSKECIILHQDHVELPCNQKSQRQFYWSEVKCIQWPKGHSENPVRIYLSSSKNLFSAIPISLSCLSNENRLTIIRYLREYSSNTTQAEWSQFCCQYAVPLIEYQQKRGVAEKTANEENTPLFWSTLIYKKYLLFINKQPFLGGMLFPLLFIIILQMHCSRKMWWMMSILIAFSACINFRLLFGHWDNLCTRITLGACGFIFITGFFAPATVSFSHRRAINISNGWTWLSIALIGIPFLFTISTLGWIPRYIPSFIMLAYLLLLFALLFYHIQKDTKKTQNAFDSETLQRWDIFENTGHLPDASPIKQ
jgi:hypothetical protein